MGQHEILVVLMTNEWMTVKKISEGTGVRENTVNRSLKRLVQMKLVFCRRTEFCNRIEYKISDKTKALYKTIINN